jgi:predicted transcriptional regulator
MMDSYKLQTIVKGFANHYRIDILRIVEKHPKISVEGIAETLNVNYKTISVHVRQMNRAGLISKRYLKSTVEHTLTDVGKTILIFLGKLE